MKSLIRCCWFLLAGSLVFGATSRNVTADEATARAQLAAIPTSAALAIRFKSVDVVVGGTTDLLNALGPVAAPVARQVEQGMAEVLYLPGFEGLDRSREVVLAVFPEMGDSVAFFLPIKDYDVLKRNVLRISADQKTQPEAAPGGFEKFPGERPTWLRRDGETLVVARHDVVVAAMAGLTPGKSLADLVSPTGVVSFSQGQMSLAVNVDGLTERFKSELAEIRQTALQAIQGLPDSSLAATGDPAAIKALYQQAGEMAFQTLDDTSWVVGYAELSAAGAEATAVVAAAPDSATSKYLAANPPTSLDSLGLLPSAAPAFVGVHFDRESLAAWTQLSQGLYSGDPANAEERKAALDQIAAAGQGPIVSSVAFPENSTSGFLVNLLMEAQDAAALRAGYRNLAQLMGEVKTPGFTQTITYQAEVEKYKAHAFDLMVQKMTLPDSQDPGVLAGKAILQKIFGGDGLQTRITSVEGLLVQATGNDPKYLQQLLDGLESGEKVLALEPEFSPTRDKLSSEANLVVLANLPQLVVDSFKMIRDVPPFNMLVGSLPFNFGMQPPKSYVGASLATEPNAVRVKVFVPIAQPRGMLEFFGGAL